MTLRSKLPLLLICLSTLATAAQPRQDTAQLQHAVEAFLRNQVSGMPGDVVVQASAPDPRLSLPLCAALEPFTTPGTRLMGKVTIGVRCTAPSAWTVYVPATVQVMANVVVGARPLSHGEVIASSDITMQKADLGQLPAGVLTDPAQAIGRTVVMSLMTGQPLRQDLLRLPPAVLAGQSVKVVSRGNGFQVSAEGKAVAAVGAGQVAQVRMASGQIISGIARQGAIVEVTF